MKWAAAQGALFGAPWKWLQIAVGRSRATTGHTNLRGLALHPGSQTPSKHWESSESTHAIQRTWWKQIWHKSIETIGWAQLDLLWFRVRMMSLLLSQSHLEIAMRMQPTKSKPANLPSSRPTSLIYLPSSNLPLPLTLALSERSHGHGSTLA